MGVRSHRWNKELYNGYHPHFSLLIRFPTSLQFKPRCINSLTFIVSGKPLFGTLIALLHKGKPVIPFNGLFQCISSFLVKCIMLMEIFVMQILGVINQPVLRERWIGIHGKRTTLNGQEISTRSCARLSNAYLYVYFCHCHFSYILLEHALALRFLMFHVQKISTCEGLLTLQIENIKKY